MGLIFFFLLLQDPSFDSVKGKIALHESRDGELKVHVNVNRTIDCGKWMINSVHFDGRGSVGRAFDSIFVKFGIGVSLHERVASAIMDDKLNEALARRLYEMRGLKSWTSSRKFIK